MPRRRIRTVVAILALSSACGADDAVVQAVATGAPATARLDMVEMLRADLEAERHPGDGGGDVRLTESKTVRAGERGEWAFEFTAGPFGIAEGGALVFQVSPFWGWSPPQPYARDAPGYTVVATDAPGVELDVNAPAEGMLTARVVGRPLAAGDVVRVRYGAGPAGATADRFAERESTFWFAVDADGDGIRSLLAECPTIEVLPRSPVGLAVHLPSVARPGEPARLVVAALDDRGNATRPLPGSLVLAPDDPGVVEIGALPSADALADGRADVTITPRAIGTIHLEVTSGSLSARTNPMQVTRDSPRILWADLHGHSALSDGTGTPEDYFTYARDVAALDVASLTDHDHWGLRSLDADPGAQRRIADAVAAFDDPGRFVALPGYEWTSWIHGHRHVLFFDGRPADVFTSLAPATESPTGLWRALAGREAITVTHHTGGGPIATNWDVPPDPRFEPVTEVVSVHGSSEAEDSPARIYSPVRGHFARDALDRGYRLGFVGSGDSHDGHPGLAHLGAATGGVAGLVGAEPTTASVLAALRSRRVYATSGPRIILRFAIDDVPMGGRLAVGSGAGHTAWVDVIGTATLERIDLVRSGAVVGSQDGLEGEAATFTIDLEDLRPGEYLYVRVLQRDGGLAWSSPVFTE